MEFFCAIKHQPSKKQIQHGLQLRLSDDPSQNSLAELSSIYVGMGRESCENNRCPLSHVRAGTKLTEFHKLFQLVIRKAALQIEHCTLPASTLQREERSAGVSQGSPLSDCRFKEHISTRKWWTSPPNPSRLLTWIRIRLTRNVLQLVFCGNLWTGSSCRHKKAIKSI